MATFELRVNGKTVSIDAPADMPLLWALREDLGLMATKYGCGAGLCGACTVHLDGFATRACSISVADAAGSDIVTLEGLSANADHPVQRAWREFDVPQCGYCQPGFIMAVSALLKETPRPSDADIDAAIANLCRCGTYPRMRAAIKRAADLMAGA